jgi:hypothetical protein
MVAGSLVMCTVAGITVIRGRGWSGFYCCGQPQIQEPDFRTTTLVAFVVVYALVCLD